jgi:Fasciclin domain
MLLLLLLLPLPASAGSQTLPPAPALNITTLLLNANDFNVAASMLQASGVAAEFQGYEHGVGITLFVPTDLAFATSDRDHNSKFRSLPAHKKALVLKFHALHSYYPLGSLQSIVNPVQPTVATEDTAAGLYTLNITRVNGSVAIGTGLVQAAITRTVFDQNPVAIFAVSQVLLPKEVFGRSRDSKVTTAAAPEVELGGTTPHVAAPTAMGPGADGKGSTLISRAARKGRGTTAAVEHLGQVTVILIVIVISTTIGFV